MAQRATIAVYSWIQPSDNAWEKAHDMVSEWNKNYRIQWFVYPPDMPEVISYQIDFDDVSVHEFQDLTKILKQFNTDYDLAYDIVYNE